MLESHPNLLTPRPSYRLKIGGYIVDLSLREVASAEKDDIDPIRITAKAQGVLMALVAHAGRVVGREALMDWVWPDTTPNEDVLTQAITQLRKAFGDSRKQTAYIETISKHGYRLIAPVEWLPSNESLGDAPTHDGGAPTVEALPENVADVDEAEPKPVPEAAKTKLATIAAIAIVAVVSGLLLGWPGVPSSFLSPATDAAVDAGTGYQRIASSLELEFLPSLSPDGAMVVYARGNNLEKFSSLMIQTTSPLPPRPLTKRLPGRFDMMPAWSPDGQTIAFVRLVGTECSIMRIPAIGGDEREIGPCVGDEQRTIHWYPDGKSLISTGQIEGRSEGSALYRMSIESGRWERIQYQKSTEDFDDRPAVSPDGRWIAFHRNGATGDLWLIPGTGGAAERLTHFIGNFSGLAWTPDSAHLVFSRTVDDESVLSQLTVATGEISDLPDLDTSVESPSIAFKSGAIAVQTVDRSDVIKRLRVTAGRTAVADAETLFPSSGANRLPAISPEGKQIAFVSDRTGQPLLWWSQRSDLDSLRPMEGFTPLLRAPPTWNEASTHLLAAGTGPGGDGLYEIDAKRASVVQLPVPEPNPIQAVYHPDPGKLLVVGVRRDGGQSLTLYDRSSRPWRVLSRIDDDVAVVAVDRANDRILFGRRENQEIWAADLSLRNPRQIDLLHSMKRSKTLTATAEGAWVLDVRPDCSWYWHRLVDKRTTRDDDVCLGNEKALRLDAVVGYDASNGEIFLSMTEYQFDIGYIPALSGIAKAKVAAGK